jgi:peptidoglycan/xylan/chitin deacetylase (PgdA/CDA1 family)
VRAILTYHAIDSSESAISVSEPDFRRHMAWLATQAIEVLPLERVRDRSPKGDAVALTFDDGFRNFAEIAHPVLEDYGFHSTVFVVPGHVGGDNRWGGAEAEGIPTLPLMDWSELASLVKGGGVSVGAHSVAHPHLTRLEDQALERELSRSRSEIENQLGYAPVTFAYPYGDHDKRVVEATARHFDLACSTRLSVLGADDSPLSLPRLDMFYFRKPGRLEAWGSSGFRRYVRMRHAIRTARRRLPFSGA